MNSYIELWKERRQRARTDLMYLCREVLMYRDIEEIPHRELIDHCQQFQGGEDTVDEKGRLTNYQPKIDCWELSGPRSRLFLFPRGHLKTTIITIAHSIQWIINYPDIRLLLSMAIGAQTKNVITEIKAHFQYNERFRALLPEFCPLPRKAGEFGTQDGFTVPARKRKWLKEPTLSTCTVGTVIAGMHYEVEKHSDLVDKENVRTPEQIRTVIDHFRYMSPLLERNPRPPHRGWVDVEGTRYDFSDLYGAEIIDKDEQTPKEKREWSILVRGAYDGPKGTPIWPTRWTKDALESEKRSMGDYLFSAQYLNNPIPDSGGLATKEDIVWVPPHLKPKILPRLRLHSTVDLHGMEDNETNDFTVITVGGFDTDGRLYVVEVNRGHFNPFEVIEFMFSVYKRYPQLIDFKIEKDAHARVLLPFMRREMEKRAKWLPVIEIKRDNRQSKQNRIKSLQPWFKQGIIRFFDDLPAKIPIILEVTRFPKYSHDDILDTLADLMQNRDSDGVTYDLIPAPHGLDIPYKKQVVDKFMGFGTDGQQQWSGDSGPERESYHDRTGL